MGNMRYRGTSNRKLMIGLSAGGIVIVLIKLFHTITNVNHLNEQLKQQQVLDKSQTLFVITDTITLEKDTITMEEYNSRQGKLTGIIPATGK
jgi:hypothetical protein